MFYAFFSRGSKASRRLHTRRSEIKPPRATQGQTGRHGLQTLNLRVKSLVDFTGFRFLTSWRETSAHATTARTSLGSLRGSERRAGRRWSLALLRGRVFSVVFRLRSGDNDSSATSSRNAMYEYMVNVRRCGSLDLSVKT